MKKKITGNTGLACKLLLACGAVLFLSVIYASFSYAAEESYLKEGYRLFFKYHPPHPQIPPPPNRDPYPYPGAMLHNGDDIPVCAAAKIAQSYARKKELKFILHGKDGWLFRTIDFRTDFKAESKSLTYFKLLNKALAAKGQVLVIVLQPPRAMLEVQHADTADIPKEYTTDKARQGYKSFLKQLSDSGILTVDLSDNIPSNFDYFYSGDPHWRPQGARLSAKQVADVVKSLPSYPTMEKNDFDSEISGLNMPVRGAFEEFIQHACHINIGLTSKPQWSTSPKTKSNELSQDLLGDVKFPSITLVGTSNSAEDPIFNFAGSLKHFLKTDIYNAAISAGGFGTASYRYYASNEYHDHPPKVIIWEFLSHYNFNGAEAMTDFRQMLPAVYGACSKKEALANYSGNITANDVTFFEKLKGINLKNTYIYLEVTNPEERKLQLKILYADGNADNLDFSRNTRTDNNGKYYLELGDKTSEPSLLFKIVTDRAEGHLNARICHYPAEAIEEK